MIGRLSRWQYVREMEGGTR
jgi:hypothetical protein